jgi:hypothetical protein
LRPSVQKVALEGTQGAATGKKGRKSGKGKMDECSVKADEEAEGVQEMGTKEAW